MDNNLDKMKKLMKKKKLINLLLFPCCFLCYFITRSSWFYVGIMIEIISNVLKLDNFSRTLLVSLDEFFYMYSHLMVYIGGKVMSSNISKEIQKLDEDLPSIDVIEKRVLEMEDTECKIIDEDEILKVYNIVERFEMLPRSKQMEILNYIKGDLSLEDRELSEDIKELSDKYKDTLQTECEDILFPDYDEDREELSRKRKK